MASTEEKLNPKQKLFCEYFASDREFFGNGTQAYIEAYDIDTSKKGAYSGARASASALLTKPNILACIDSLLENAVLNDQFVDKQIAFLIAQSADYSAKISAIKEYNALKQRITKKLKVEVDDPRGDILNKYMGDDDVGKTQEAKS
jgi:phage terminase small subunit